MASEYRYHPLGIDTPCKTQELEYSFYTEYRYPPMSIDTLLRFVTPPGFQNGEYRYPKSSIDTYVAEVHLLLVESFPTAPLMISPTRTVGNQLEDIKTSC
ncbi:hypothetical protein GQ457_03G016010 [Hibiscus cannabinus]